MNVGRMMALACILTTAIVSKAFSQENWAKRKCDLYSEAWGWVLQMQDLAGVGTAFIDQHQAFFDANCYMPLLYAPLPRVKDISQIFSPRYP
ncbi:hypothetical protein KBY27_22520 [Ruegeria pomeroyi]|uniref:Uncharacterized protein n=1 Tax=Ruegeria pomeroyi TaxID=89184 RepID=A0A9Q3WQK0_9RHOB|nr:hypothetical protein [Ruegeria pomeroyi]